MELNEYLEGLRNCPDETITRENVFTNRLTAEFGIYDNWDILLNADYDEVVRDLTDSMTARSLFQGQYRFVRDCQSDASYRNKLFEYVPGEVMMQVGNIVPPGGIIEGDENEPWIFHANRQQREFSMAICLHPYQKKRMNGVKSCNRAMALVTIDIAEYAKKKKFPLCLPGSIGYAHKGDFSRIVYYLPE